MKKLIYAAGAYKDFIGNFPPSSLEEQFQWIAEAGFDGTFTSWKEGCMRAVAQNVEKAGLYYQSVHAPFNNVNVLWETGETGDVETDRLIRCVRECSEIGVNLVIMHAGKTSGEVQTQKCLERFEKIVKEAEKSGVVLALENTGSLDFLRTLWTSFKDDKHVAFCFDTGHENGYTPDVDVLKEFGTPICLHLHDNMGKTLEPAHWYDDAHMLPFDGTCNWEKITNDLKSLGYTGDVTLEVMGNSRPDKNTHDIYKNLTYKEFLALACEKAKKFRSMID